MLYLNVNITHSLLIQTIKAAEEHLLVVTKERSNYRTICQTTKDEIHAHFALANGNFAPPPPNSALTSNSNRITVHYSFDMAQQVFYPNNPLQPGPMYFLTPRKCAIFGVCCEGIPRQINYLIDEAINTGKGANSIVSMLDHYFDNHSLGEDTAMLHADNCTG